MHHSSLISILTFVLFNLGAAQTAAGQDHCWIKYSYDPAGNRIKREWWCGDPNQDPDPKEEVKSRQAEDFGFRVAPVPAMDELTFTSTRSLENAELEVVNLQGRTVLKQGINGTRADIDLSGLAPGVYILRVREQLTEYTREFNIVR